MPRSIPKKFFHFSLFFGSSLILLITVNILSIYLTLPDIKVWKSKNPDRTFLSQKHHINANKLRFQYIPLNQIPGELQECLILSEDASFYVHDGIDWFEIRKSITRNIKEHKFIRGGSTITQQVAKNLYLNKEKKISRKIKELFLAARIDRDLSKKRILEVYFNIAQFGKNIFGIKAAANYYYNKTPAQLTTAEIVQLISILPNPIIMHPKKLNRSLKWRCRVLVRRLYHYDKIDKVERDNLMQLYR